MSGAMFLIFLLNFAIAWFTCYMAGRVWVEARAIGGYADLMVWSSAILAAAGFTMAFLPLITTLAGAYFDLSAYNPLQPPFAQRFLHIVVGLGGLAICTAIYLWTQHVLEKQLIKLDEVARHGFIETYDAFHQINRLGRAVRSTSHSLTSVERMDASAFFLGGDKTTKSSSGSSSDRGKISPLFLIVLALAAGVILTIVLIRYYAGAQETPVYRHIIAPLQQAEWEEARRARVARRDANLRAAETVTAQGSAPPGNQG